MCVWCERENPLSYIWVAQNMYFFSHSIFFNSIAYKIVPSNFPNAFPTNHYFLFFKIRRSVLILWHIRCRIWSRWNRKEKFSLARTQFFMVLPAKWFHLLYTINGTMHTRTCLTQKKIWKKKKKKTARILVGCSHKRDACWRMCFTWHNSHKLHHHHHHHQHHMVKRLYRNPYIDLVRNDIELIICRSNWEKLTTTKKKKKLEKKRQPTSQT